MRVKKKFGVVAAAVALAATSIMIDASPASAATDPTAHCTVTELSNNGFYFSCSGTRPTTVHLELYCLSWSGVAVWKKEDSKEIGAPWSFGAPLRCDSHSYKGSPHWSTS